MLSDRSCGILLHITSLPSAFGIGDFGPEAYRFADFLNESKIKFWQILPLNPTSPFTGNSPYSSDSAFAGNILLISPELLAEEGLVRKADLKYLVKINNTEEVSAEKISLLKKAYINFKANKRSGQILNEFRKEHNYWLNDYSLFKILKSKYNNISWVNWPKDLKDRKRDVIYKTIRENSECIKEQIFFQYIFFKQWVKLKNYCNERNISIIGDIPYYISHDSADVWSFPEYYKLDKSKNAECVGGVPPDYFSKTGQLWGNPAYNWKLIRKNKFDWWIKRIEHNLKWTDILRLDHFRAFSAYWEVPANETTAINGKWIKVPGEELFSTLSRRSNNIPLIAEDLGDIDEPVRNLINKFKFPGMRVLQFAFDSKINDSPDAPHRHIKNCVVYTGTHDNHTTRGWFNKLRNKDNQKINSYLGIKVNENNAAERFIRIAMMSVANLCVIPMQDFLNLGDEATMNRPGTSKGNWKWRLKKNQLTAQMQKHIGRLVKLYERS